MKSSISLLTIVMTLFFSACGSGQNAENKKIKDEIIEVHDEVMPLMGKLKSLEKEANEKIKELESLPNQDSLQLEELKSVAFDLSQAYEGMFVWMRQYKVNEEGLASEELKIYLEEQKIKVDKVNEDIKNALERASKVLKD